MPIEFRCIHCQKLLRTPDDSAGKQAKCPECGAIVAIPPAGTASMPPGGAGPAPETAGLGSTPFGPSSATTNPYQSPGEFGYGSASGGPAGLAPTALQPTRIEMGDIFSRTWTIFKDQWGTCFVALLIVGGLNFATQMLMNLVVGATGQGGNDAVAALAFFVAWVAVMLFNAWINVGQMIFFLKVARGQPAQVGDLFSGGPYFLSFLGAAILVGLAVMGGLLLFIVPGIILGLMFSQFGYLIVDGRAGALESLAKSRELMVGNKLMVLATWIVAAVVGIVVIVCTCFLGALAVGPYMAIMAAVIYLAVSGQPTADQTRFAATGTPGYRV